MSRKYSQHYKGLTDVVQQVELVSSIAQYSCHFFEFEDEDQNLDDSTDQEKMKKTKRRRSSVDDARVQVTTK